MKKSDYFDFQELQTVLYECDITAGDIVYVASSMASLIGVKNSEENVINLLSDVIGKNGTIVMPTFSFDFCDNGYFNLKTTDTFCGNLPRHFMKRECVYRTKHTPIHTVAASGKYAKEISHIYTLTSFGKDSVFEWLYQQNAKILLLGCNFYSGVAHVHWLEERFKVPYRYWVEIEGTIVDENGNESKESFLRFKRKNDRIKTSTELLEKEMCDVIFKNSIGLLEISTFNLADFAKKLFPLFEENKNVMLDKDGIKELSVLAAQ